ncbi:hypothetical protein GCM10027174_08030 [Salinifilum aidingensis]
MSERSFAEKLTHLIQTVHPPDRRPYSYREIETAIKDHPGAMTAAYVQQLANGKQPNPRKNYIEALAWFFGVPVGYFFDDEAARQDGAGSEGATGRRETEEGRLVRRLHALSPEHRNAVSTVIDQLAEHERQHRGRGRRGRRSTAGDEV